MIIRGKSTKNISKARRKLGLLTYLRALGPFPPSCFGARLGLKTFFCTVEGFARGWKQFFVQSKSLLGVGNDFLHGRGARSGLKMIFCTVEVLARSRKQFFAQSRGSLGFKNIFPRSRGARSGSKTILRERKWRPGARYSKFIDYLCKSKLKIKKYANKQQCTPENG